MTVEFPKRFVYRSRFKSALKIVALLTLSLAVGDEVAAANAMAQVNGPGRSTAGSETTVFPRKSDDGALTIEPAATIAVAAKGDRGIGRRGGRSVTQLYGDWRVEEIGGKAVIAGSETSLAFEPDGRIHGNGSCNRFFGSFRLTKGRLKISETGASMMACDPPLMDQERNFLNALEAVDHFGANSTRRLRLFSADGRILVGLRRQ